MAPSSPVEFRLTADQLSYLRQFIARRGFGEPATLLEILDHFACKVEELWPQNPDWTLEKTAEAAHNSFGASGFYPLVKAFHDATQKRYRMLFNRLFWQLPQTLGGALALLRSFWGYYTLGSMGDAQNWQVFGAWNAVAAVAYVLVITVNLVLMWEQRPNAFLRYANRATNTVVQIGILVVLLVPARFLPVAAEAGLFMLAVWYLQTKAAVRKIALREHQKAFQQVYGTP